jgi:serine/threonine-protein kinase
MGILTKHLLEQPVPPRKRRPELEILPEVEAICLRAMEKDRDKRYPDMDAFYRALGAAGDLTFEPSQVFVPPRLPKASLKYPTLAAANQEARASMTAVAVPGTFEDERPGQRSDTVPAGSRKPLMLALVGAAVVAAIVVAVLALKPSSPPAPAAPVNLSPATGPAPVAAPPADTPPPEAKPATPPESKSAETAKAATPPAATGDTPSSKRSRRHRGDSDEQPKADPLHRSIPVPAEPTPAELKAFPGVN